MIQIPLGRKDVRASSAAEADAKLPPATSTVDRVLSLFGSFGMTAEESVAILGAHTVTQSLLKSVRLNNK